MVDADEDFRAAVDRLDRDVSGWVDGDVTLAGVLEARAEVRRLAPHQAVSPADARKEDTP